MNRGAWLDECGHSDLEHVENVWIIDEIEYNVAFSWALGVKSQTLVVAIELCCDHAWVRKLDSHLDAFDAIGKEMSMLVLEFNWHFQSGSKRKAQCFIEVMFVCRRQGVYVGDQHVQHDNLITPGLILGNMDCDLAVLIKCTNGLVVYQLDYRSLCFPIFISLAWIIVHTLHTVTKLQPRIIVLEILLKVRGGSK